MYVNVYGVEPPEPVKVINGKGVSFWHTEVVPDIDPFGANKLLGVVMLFSILSFKELKIEVGKPNKDITIRLNEREAIRWFLFINNRL